MINQKSRSTLWIGSLNKEMKNLLYVFDVIDKNVPASEGRAKSSSNLVWDAYATIE